MKPSNLDADPKEALHRCGSGVPVKKTKKDPYIIRHDSLRHFSKQLLDL